MKIKKIGVALVAALALTAFAASMAHAEAGHWNFNGAELSGSKEVQASKVGSTALELTAPELGFKLTASGIECVGCTISNNGTAHSAGKLKFTGVSVDEPEGCVVASTLETKELQDEVIMSETNTYDKFFPSEGTTFITIKISECAAAGKYNVSGTAAGLAVTEAGGGASETGVERGTQVLRFQGNTAGTALTLGGKSASLMGEVANSLVGGGTFSAHS